MFMHDAQHTGLIGYDYLFEEVTLVGCGTSRLPQQARTAMNFLAHHHPGYAGVNGPWIFDHPYIDSSPVVYDGRVIVGSWVSGRYPDGAGLVRRHPVLRCGHRRRVVGDLNAAG